MRILALAVAGATAIAGCGGVAGVPPPVPDRIIAQAEAQAGMPAQVQDDEQAPAVKIKPTLDQLKDLIPPTLDQDEMKQMTEEPDETPPADVDEAAPDAALAPSRVDRGVNVRGRAGKGARGKVARVGRIAAPKIDRGAIGPAIGRIGGPTGPISMDRGSRKPGLRQELPIIGPIGRDLRPGRRPIFRDRWFPRHRTHFRHRIWWDNTWLRPMHWGAYYLYPVVYQGVPWYVQYCRDPITGLFAPCGIMDPAELGYGGFGIGPYGGFGGYGGYDPIGLGAGPGGPYPAGIF